MQIVALMLVMSHQFCEESLTVAPTYNVSIIFQTQLQPTPQKCYGINHNSSQGRKAVMKKYVKSEMGTREWGGTRNISLFMCRVPSITGPSPLHAITVPIRTRRNEARFQSSP